MTAHAKIQPVAYSLANTFAASGYIHGPLMRLQWSDRFAAMEDEIAAAWRKEARPNPQQIWHEVNAEPRAKRTAASIQAATDSCAVKREARYARIIEVLAAHGPQKSEGIGDLLGLTQSPAKRIMRDMEDAGLVEVYRTPNGRHVFYGIGTDWIADVARDVQKAPKRTKGDRAAYLAARRQAHYAAISAALAGGPLRLSEIAERVEFSPRSAAEYINAMIALGMLVRCEINLGGKLGRAVTYRVAQ